MCDIDLFWKWLTTLGVLESSLEESKVITLVVDSDSCILITYLLSWIILWVYVSPLCKEVMFLFNLTIIFSLPWDLSYYRWSLLFDKFIFLSRSFLRCSCYCISISFCCYIFMIFYLISIDESDLLNYLDLDYPFISCWQ